MSQAIDLTIDPDDEPRWCNEHEHDWWGSSEPRCTKCGLFANHRTHIDALKAEIRHLRAGK